MSCWPPCRPGVAPDLARVWPARRPGYGRAMTTQLKPVDLASFFASLDRRLDEREPRAEGEIDEGRRDVEMILADIDKRLVLLGFGEGELEQPLGRRVADRLQRLDDDDWSKPAAVDGTGPSLLETVRRAVDDASASLR